MVCELSHKISQHPNGTQALCYLISTKIDVWKYILIGLLHKYPLFFYIPLTNVKNLKVIINVIKFNLVSLRISHDSLT